MMLVEAKIHGSGPDLRRADSAVASALLRRVFPDPHKMEQIHLSSFAWHGESNETRISARVWHGMYRVYLSSRVGERSLSDNL
jgi:hypothetical protein